MRVRLRRWALAKTNGVAMVRLDQEFLSGRAAINEVGDGLCVLPPVVVRIGGDAPWAAKVGVLPAAMNRKADV